MRILFTILMAIILAACQSSGSSSGATGPGTPSGPSDPAIVDNGTMEPADDGEVLRVLSIAGEEVALEVDDREFNLDQSFTQSESIIYDVESSAYGESYFLVIDGEYARAVILDHDADMEGLDDFQALGRSSNISPVRLNGMVEYDGVYQVVSAQNTNISGFEQEIELVVDFGSGMIEGRSTSGLSTEIRGVIEGNAVELNIRDFAGFHEGVGWFYGPNSAELIGAYLDISQSGALYAQQK